MFDVHGWDGTSERLHEHQAKGDFAAMAETFTDEMLDVFTLTASWDGLADAIVERYTGIADRVICYFAATAWRDDPATKERWAAVAAEVAARA
ncbi:MAG: hypothetical protein H0T70_03670 [Acidimicrobiia bacterium]|nr:hypothetical protein [Acidimicrobiia bacterium]